MKKLFCIFLIIFGVSVLFFGFTPKAEARPIITVEPLPSATEGQPYRPPDKLKATGGTGSYTWTAPYPTECNPLLLSSELSDAQTLYKIFSSFGFSLSPQGEIKATKIVIPEGVVTPIDLAFYVGLKDSEGECAKPQKFTIQIKSAGEPTSTAMPVIQTTEVPPGQINKEYKPRGKTFYFKANPNSGCDTNYKWQKFGDLPAGLIFKEDGSITGTPQAVEKKEFSVRVKDGCGSFSNNGNYKEFTITIYPEIPLNIITQSVPPKETNQTYQATLQSEGGLPPYGWEILLTDREGNLFEKPARWLTLSVPSGNAETVNLGGITPSEPGDYQFSAFVMDANYDYVMKEFLIEVGRAGSPGSGQTGQTISCLDSSIDTKDLKTYKSGDATMSYDGLVPCGKCLLVDGTLTYVPCNFCHLFIMTNNIIKFVMGGVVPAIAVLMLIIGGVLFLFAGAKADLLNKAKGIITSVVIGLLIIFSAWVIVNTVFDKSGIIKTEGWRWYEVGCAEN